MAFPTVDKPYGLQPINLIGGQVFAGSTRMFPIASGYATDLFYGDLVKLTTDGTVIKEDATSGTTATAGIVGVFLGCEYSQTGGPIFGKVRKQYWPASTVAPDAVAYVCDDPDAIFRAAVCNTGTTIAYVGQWAVGKNAGLLQNTGSTATGNSAVAVGGAAPAATAKIVRIMGVVPETAISINAVGSTSGSSTTVTLAAATTVYPYMSVSGTGVAAGNYVASVTNATTIVLAVAVDLTSAALTFTGSPEVLVKFNQGWHSYYNSTGAAVAT
jgi:hypothetical protein